jgi:hypothetical protein
MLVSGATGNWRVKVCTSMRTAMYMMARLRQTRHMGGEATCISLDKVTRVNGRRTCSKELARKPNLMAVNTTVISKQDESMVKGCSGGLTELFITVSGETTR